MLSRQSLALSGDSDSVLCTQLTAHNHGWLQFRDLTLFGLHGHCMNSTDIHAGKIPINTIKNEKKCVWEPGTVRHTYKCSMWEARIAKSSRPSWATHEISGYKKETFSQNETNKTNFFLWFQVWGLFNIHLPRRKTYTVLENQCRAGWGTHLFSKSWLCLDLWLVSQNKTGPASTPSLGGLGKNSPGPTPSWGRSWQLMIAGVTGDVFFSGVATG